MPWNLTEEEVSAVMDAVKAVIEPWLGWHEIPNAIRWINEDGSETLKPLKHRGVAANAPQEVKDLDEVYMNIVDDGACIGGGFPDDGTERQVSESE